jgi:hypothetical protein
MLEQHGFMSIVDEEKLHAAVLAQTGMPVDVTSGMPRDDGFAPAPPPALREAGTEVRELAPSARGDVDVETLRPSSGTVGRSGTVGAVSPSAARPPTERMMPTEVLVPSRATVDAARRPLSDDAR